MIYRGSVVDYLRHFLRIWLSDNFLRRIANDRKGSAAVIVTQTNRTAAIRGEAALRRCFRGNFGTERLLLPLAVIRSGSW